MVIFTFEKDLSGEGVGSRVWNQGDQLEGYWRRQNHTKTHIDMPCRKPSSL